MDFSKTEDIIFLAVSAAIGLALLAATIVVVVKGKRVTRVPDILLRVFAIVFAVASAVLIVAAVFTRLDGSVRIDLSDGAVLIAGSDSLTLPMTELFVILSTVPGLAIAAAIFVLSLAALIVDCVLARKEKKRAVKKVMTPEEAKRAAEINRIRALASSAVSKSNSASALVNDKKNKKDVKNETDDKNAPKEQPEETPKPLSPEELAKGDIEEPDWMKKPDTDWRTDENKPTSFVGIGGDESFDDSFADTFDEAEDEAEGLENESENDNAEEYVNETDEFDVDGGNFGVEEDINDSEEFGVEEDADDVNDFAAEEYVGEEGSDVIGEEDALAGDEDEYVDYGEVNRDIYIPKIRTIQRKQPSEPEKPIASEKQSSKPEKKVAPEKKPSEDKKEKAKQQPVAERKSKKAGEKAAKRTPASAASKVKPGKAAAGTEESAPVKPAPQKPAPKKIVSQKSASPKKDDKAARPSRTPATSASVVRVAKKPEKPEKPEELDNTEVKSKAKAPARPDSAPAKGKVEKPAPTKDTLTIERPTDDGRLPVNKRYIILDRKSAVNMFNEYLKERDRADKDKLESNINTIILK